MTSKSPTPSKLIAAIRASHLGGVLLALEDGADANEADIHGHRGLPLRTACFEGNLAIVRELLQRGADPNAGASDGPGAAMRLALRRNHQDIAALLLRHGAQPLHDPSTADSPDPKAATRPEKTTIDDASVSFGTDTNALSADLLFLNEHDLPPLDWPTDKTQA